MKLIIKYSLLNELKEAGNVLAHQNEYHNLRSFIAPTPKSIISFALNKNKAIKHTEKVWLSAKEDIQKAFEELDIKDIGTISCFLHGFSCEGWFDTDDNSIHIRFPKNGGDKELLNTIIHEILHLATYEEKYDYDERETIVDNFLVKSQFVDILKDVKLTNICQDC